MQIELINETHVRKSAQYNRKHCIGKHGRSSAEEDYL
jgi:hypothetical protein